MSRRPSLPGAAELFRVTGSTAAARAAVPGLAPAPNPLARPLPVHPSPPRVEPPPSPPAAEEERPPSPAPAGRRIRPAGERRPSGRQRHEEKITVYCSAEELLDLEHARLVLRAEHGLAVDRGRIVREAVAIVLAEFEAKGESSVIVRRLRET